jgi:hypothetical protein
MLKYILSALMNSGIGERDSENQTSDFRNLVDTYKAEKEKKKGVAQFDRLQDAFKQLKDMHKDDPPSPPEFNFETAHWPYGPVGAPSQAQASTPMPMARPSAAPAAVPMPMARPAEAPQASSPFADFFKRNTALMQDPNGGGYIDPTAASKALFG